MSDLCVGDRIVVDDLTRDVHLNGTEAEVVEFRQLSDGTDGAVVKFLADGALKLLRVDNLFLPDDDDYDDDAHLASTRGRADAAAAAAPASHASFHSQPGAAATSSSFRSGGALSPRAETEDLKRSLVEESSAIIREQIGELLKTATATATSTAAAAADSKKEEELKRVIQQQCSPQRHQPQRPAAPPRQLPARGL
eukprot:Rhum_TRINITY_DN14752_c9_g1::Rhum_TRINITY_DN14752_c9_g1_i1::g.115588::m.115588